MSDLRVALVAEGPTDAVVIEAALRALLPRPFILTLLQPEPTRPKLGTGWGGVLRWCDEFAGRATRLEDDVTMPGFDLFVLHVDADVADFSYASLGHDVAKKANDRGWPALPCPVPCPPPECGADVMRHRVRAWASLHELGPKTVLCVPSKATEAWLLAALIDDAHPWLQGLECDSNLAVRLAAMPRKERFGKSLREYRARSRAITDAWETVTRRCAQAARFSAEVRAVFP